jgi:hypothetical protein
MKQIAWLILILIFFSCSENVGTGELAISKSKRILLLQEKLIKEKLLEKPQVAFNPDDCTYLQYMQTDDFLKNAPELKGYVWDSISKTATVLLNDNETLKVRKGGCYDYCVSAEFIISKSKINYSDWENVFEKILWIAEILKPEFFYDELKKEIEAKNYTLEKLDNEEKLFFNSEHFKNIHLMISREIKEDLTVIKINHFF